MSDERKFDMEKFFNFSTDLLCIAGSDGYFKLINPSFERVLGWSEEVLLSKQFFEFVHPDDIESTNKEFEKLAVGIPTVGFENRYQCQDGTYRTLLWTSYAEHDTGLFYSVARDITSFQHSHEKFKYIIESSPSAMVMVEPGGNIFIANNEALRLFGYQDTGLIGRKIENLVPMGVRGGHGALCGSYFKSPEVKAMGKGRDLMAVKSDGREFPVEVGLNPVNIEGKNYVVCGIIDISNRKATEMEYIEKVENLHKKATSLEAQASHDGLTTLYNRRAFDEQILSEISLVLRKKRSLSLIIMDIDKFKTYNDTYGHQAGDTVLKIVARTLKKVARLSDFVARYGGEEFAIILPETDLGASRMAAERFRSAIESQTWDNRQVTASFGISTIDNINADDIETEEVISKIIKEADKALYQSKDRGRNRITHYSDIKKMK